MLRLYSHYILFNLAAGAGIEPTHRGSKPRTLTIRLTGYVEGETSPYVVGLNVSYGGPGNSHPNHAAVRYSTDALVAEVGNAPTESGL